jgi:hypothetical protein
MLPLYYIDHKVVNTNMFEPLSRQDQSKTNCSNAKNASVNANIQQPKPIKQFPCKYPCGNCKNAVTWKTLGVCCDSCNKFWFHKKCLGMNVLTNEVLSKKHDEKFGSPQMSQYHDTLCKP